MTYKQMQKLMGLVQYAPEEEQNELAVLLAKAASTKTVQRRVKDDNTLTENGAIKFTQKEISTMPDDIKKLFVYNNNVIHYRYYRGMYQVRFHRNGYKIEVASKDFDVMKKQVLCGSFRTDGA